MSFLGFYSRKEKDLALGFSFMLLDSDIVTQIGLNIITNHIEN
jgi:hypothetical protein